MELCSTAYRATIVDIEIIQLISVAMAVFAAGFILGAVHGVMKANKRWHAMAQRAVAASGYKRQGKGERKRRNGKLRW